MAAGDIITVGELHTALGIAAGDVDPTDDAKYGQAITEASAAIRAYADRNFAAAKSPAEDRQFEYEGGGWLEIDDAATVNSVTFNFTGYDQPLTADQFRAEPSAGDLPFTYIILPRTPLRINSAMGFTRNLDVLAAEGRLTALPVFVTVNGEWGWPVVPEDVKRAAIWTTMEFVSNPRNAQSQSIANYSYSEGAGGEETAIPKRARDLLEPYVRWLV